MASGFRIVSTPLDTCATYRQEHTRESYQYLKKAGFNTVSIGYLDAWDKSFWRLDMYGRARTLDGLVPGGIVEANRCELSRRLALASDAGLKVFMSVESPISRSYLEELSPHTSYRWEEYFGTSGDLYAGGRPPLCLSHPRVRAYYRELMADIVHSFSSVSGFTFFGGDSYSLVCDETCPRCHGKPTWQRYAEWVNELAAVARGVNPALEFYVRNWPWWDEMFEMLDVLAPGIGIIASNEWGFRYGEHGSDYPALEHPWLCHDPQGGRMPIPSDGDCYALELTQPWFVVDRCSEKFLKLASAAKRQGRPVIGWSSWITSEDMWPYFLPSPVTVLRKLRAVADAQADGIEEFWGVPPEEFRGERPNANTVALKLFLESPRTDERTLLSRAAEELYGREAAPQAVAAWEGIGAALRHWSVGSWLQRMFWPIRLGTAGHPFYALDLSVPPPEIKSPEEPDPRWWPHRMNADMCRKIAANREEVTTHYDAAMASYREVVRLARDKHSETAAFHLKSLELGRTLHLTCRNTMLAYAAHWEKDRAALRRAIAEELTNRTQTIALIRKLRTVPYDLPKHEAALERMRAFVERQGDV